MKIEEAFDIAEEIVNILVTDFEATNCKEFILERLDITDETLSEALAALMDDLTVKED